MSGIRKWRTIASLLLMVTVLAGLRTGLIAQTTTLGACDEWSDQGGASPQPTCWCYTTECREWLYGEGNWESTAFEYCYEVCNTEYCGGPWYFTSSVAIDTGQSHCECQPRCMPDGGCGC